MLILKYRELRTHGSSWWAPIVLNDIVLYFLLFAQMGQEYLTWANRQFRWRQDLLFDQQFKDNTDDSERKIHANIQTIIDKIEDDGLDFEKDAEQINPNTKLYIFGIDKVFFNKRETRTLLNHNIFLKGRVSKNELKKYYNKSMGMICLGYDETFCINAIEAFSCGLPLITFGLTAVSELIDNKNSFKINNFDELDKKILKILDMNKLQRKRLINYCYIFSKRYQIQKIIPLWERVFNS